MYRYGNNGYQKNEVGTGGMDYGSLFSNKGQFGGIFGGGSSSSGGYGGASYGQSPSNPNSILNQLNTAIDSGIGPRVGSADQSLYQGAEQSKFIQNNGGTMLQNENALALAGMNNSSAQSIAEMNAKVTLAAQMAQLESQRLQAEADRAQQIEMQRREFGSKDYGTKQQFYYQYGL